MRKTPAQQRQEDLAGMVAHFEGREHDAYQLHGEDFHTIGIGATSYEDGSPIGANDRLTDERVDELFKFHLNRAMEKVRNEPGYQKLPPNAQSAVQSFAFNVGPNFMDANQGDNFATISKAIRAGDPQAVADALPLYDNGGVPGLVRRRAKEAELALRPAMDPVDSTLRNDMSRAIGTEAVLKGKPVLWGGKDYGWQSPESYGLIYNR